MAESKIKELNEKDFEDSVLKSKEEVLVKFGAPWCSGCQALEPILNDFNEKHQNKIKIYSVDVDKNPEIALKYHIMSIPTMLIFKNGKIIKHLINTSSLKEIEEKLSEYI